MKAVAVRLRRSVLTGLRRFHPDRDLVAAEFDVKFYLRAHPDVARSGLDPIEHFLKSGWREGRDPSRDFSVREYLEANPDVAAADMNPFVHYLRAGRAEGRKPRQDLGFRYDILSGLKTVEARVAEAARASAGAPARPEAELAAALAARRGSGGVHLTFSHDDYTANLGGVQLCLQREAAAVERAGLDHLHLHPAAAWPVLRAGEAAPMGVVWNGRSVGAWPAAAIVKVLRGSGLTGGSLAIHSLLGHDAGEVLKLAAALRLKAGFFWLHDFASLCAGFHLLRDDVEDCAAPPPQSAACSVCIYGPWRARHIEGHARLFDALKLTAVSPSQPTLELWAAVSDFRAAGQIVLPHARLVERGPAPAPRRPRPLRVGFLGLPAAHKGWPIFRELAFRHADDPRYEFHHFGMAAAGVPAVFHPVSAKGYAPQAMQAAVAAAELDVALIWPLCRETFSFTAYEAVAGGASVVTGPDSGNVAAFVEAGGHGLVLPDEEALVRAFETGDILALGRARRGARLYDLEYSALTMDLIAREARP